MRDRGWQLSSCSKCKPSRPCQRIRRRKSLSSCQSTPDVNFELFPMRNEPQQGGFSGYMDRVTYRLVFFLHTCMAAMLFGHSASAQVEAVVGEPFGVAQITVPMPRQDAGLGAERTTLTLEGPPGRVHYPAVNEGVLKRLLGRDAPPRANLTVTFLFRGERPFEITVGTPTLQRFAVTPQRKSAAAHARVLRRWWQSYNGLFREMAGETDHPPLVETYLTAMLARRLDLAAPLLERLRSEPDKTEGRQTLELLTGAETMRLEILKAASFGVLPPAEEATRPLPEAVAWRSLRLPSVEGDVAIEPMAMRVPEECFYVRFGLYANYLWLNALTEDYSGDIGSMLSARVSHRDQSASTGSVGDGAGCTCRTARSASDRRCGADRHGYLYA